MSGYTFFLIRTRFKFGPNFKNNSVKIKLELWVDDYENGSANFTEARRFNLATSYETQDEKIHLKLWPKDQYTAQQTVKVVSSP